MNAARIVVAVSVMLLLSSAAVLGELAVNADIQSSVQGYQGVVMVNQAAGSGQQQVNVRSLAVGNNGSISVSQTQDKPAQESLTWDTSSSIRGNSFSQGNGILGVNQSAGAGNQQVNLLRIDFGAKAETLNDTDLAASIAPSSINSGTVALQNGGRSVSIDDQAFADSRGVVQLNQSAGTGNRMVNSLGIRIMD